MGKTIKVTIEVEDKGTLTYTQDGETGKITNIQSNYTPGFRESSVRGASYLDDGQVVKYVWEVGQKPIVQGSSPVPPHVRPH